MVIIGIENLQMLCPNCAAKDDLINKFKELKSFVAVGQFYKVSDSTVRKWCKKYEIPYTKKELVLFLKDTNQKS